MDATKTRRNETDGENNRFVGAGSGLSGTIRSVIIAGRTASNAVSAEGWNTRIHWMRRICTPAGIGELNLIQAAVRLTNFISATSSNGFQALQKNLLSAHNQYGRPTGLPLFSLLTAGRAIHLRPPATALDSRPWISRPQPLAGAYFWRVGKV